MYTFRDIYSILYITSAILYVEEVLVVVVIKGLSEQYQS